MPLLDDMTRSIGRQVRRLAVACRPRPLFVPLGDHAVTRTWRGDPILLMSRDLGITPIVALTGHWERHIERLLCRLLRPGMVAVDVGANVGYHTLGMAHGVGPEGHVHAFEAHPRLAHLLGLTLHLSRLAARTTVHPVAVGDRAGEAQLAVDPLHAGSGHLAWEGSHARYSDRYDVPCVRLDDALAHLPRVDLLRMDIEGSEGLALRGAREIVRRSPGLRVVMEWDPVQMSVRTDVDEVVQWIADEGFAAAIIRFGRLEPVAPEALAQLSMSDILLSRPGQGPP